MRRTEAIKATRTHQQLLLVVQQHAADFDRINLGAACTHASKLCREGVAQQQQPAAVQILLSEMHQLAVRLQQHCEARGLANIIHSCSKLCMPDTAKLMVPLFLQASALQQAKPQDVSNVLWAAATLQLKLLQFWQMPTHRMCPTPCGLWPLWGSRCPHNSCSSYWGG
jgi:hypothetical protein